MRSRTHVATVSFLLSACLLTAAAARADEGDPHHGTFPLAEATKGLPGPAAGPLQAVIETSKGKFTCELFDKQAPVTVANFIGLATGKRTWLDPKTQKWIKKKPFYDGLIFHRVIPGFMIQGGDPQGTGMGNAGFQFSDEIVPELTFDKPGLLAMANAGRHPDGSGTNSSQFFITEGTPTYLNGRHTIFGQCEPLSLVTEITHVQTGPGDRPVESVVIKKVTISHAKPAKGAAAAKAAPADKAGNKAGNKPNDKSADAKAAKPAAAPGADKATAGDKAPAAAAPPAATP
jgi:peptidyl-prolyl cis-trans isomerase A (cyclophilin A)